jgi:hypothetical protein
VTCGHRLIFCLHTPMITGGRIRFVCRRSWSGRCRVVCALIGLTQPSDYKTTTSAQRVDGDAGAKPRSPPTVPDRGRDEYPRAGG